MDKPSQRDLDAYRPALVAHCYRMMGSIADAEDLAQEALIRAWRAMATFEGRSTLQTWLYSIATRVCLDDLARRKRRAVKAESFAVEPFPDAALSSARDLGPEARYTSLESINAAFLEALHRLSPRQRAVLILRDVLGWRAEDVSERLGWSVGAVNIALHRARGAARRRPVRSQPRGGGAAERALLRRYIAAWEASDWDAIESMLARDVSFRMPPERVVLHGPRRVMAFLTARLGAADRFQIVQTRANGAPTLAAYRASGRRFSAYAMQRLTTKNGRIASITVFRTRSLFPAFGLPMTVRE